MVMRIRGRDVDPKDIESLTKKTLAEVNSNNKKKFLHSPYHTERAIRETLNAWDCSKPNEQFWLRGKKLGTYRTALGLSDNQPKSYWKDFPSEEALIRHLIHESDYRCIQKRKEERNLADKVLQHQNTAKVLDNLRRELGAYLWRHDSYLGQTSYYIGRVLNWFPNMGGSYNLANSYPAYERSELGESLDRVDPAAAGMVLMVQQLWDYTFRKKDRLSLLFDQRSFTVSENIAILHDVKELFSPHGNLRVLPTGHRTIIPHPYQGASSPDEPQRWHCDGRKKRVPIQVKNTDGSLAEFITNLNIDSKKKRESYKGEIKWDQGRAAPGTRNEDSPDTKMARAHFMPLEMGRSHTAARLFEMVSLLRTTEPNELFESRMKAMAFGIFGYWNADVKYGGYPKSLTPIHTYHEVMDPAEDYLKGIYANPFTYKDVTHYLKKG